MIISSLQLTNFRNYRRKTFEFFPQVTLVVGPNGSGKTNLLEGIYLLATGRGWRTSSTEEMIRFDAEVSHIIGKVSDVSKVSEVSKAGEDQVLHITLTRGFINGKRTSKLRYQVNGAGKRKADFVGRLKVVLFEPESLDIVVGEPRARRAFLDELLTQTDQEYVRALSVYAKALRSRNRLLDRIREGKEREEVLEYWERALVKHGTAIQEARRKLIEWIDTSFKGLEVTYQPRVMSQARLDRYRQREIAAGFTFVGPQRDDMVIAQARGPKRHAKGRVGEALGLAAFGSRGEQRMAVLRLKLLEAEWIKKESEEKPVILLDDIFSELDEEHKKMVGSLVKDRQAIITATEMHQGHYPEGRVVKLT